jgi:hypothetical protein
MKNLSGPLNSAVTHFCSEVYFRDKPSIKRYQGYGCMASGLICLVFLFLYPTLEIWMGNETEAARYIQDLGRFRTVAQLKESLMAELFIGGIVCVLCLLTLAFFLCKASISQNTSYKQQKLPRSLDQRSFRLSLFMTIINSGAVLFSRGLLPRVSSPQ